MLMLQHFNNDINATKNNDTRGLKQYFDSVTTIKSTYHYTIVKIKNEKLLQLLSLD